MAFERVFFTGYLDFYETKEIFQPNVGLMWFEGLAFADGPRGPGDKHDSLDMEPRSNVLGKDNELSPQPERKRQPELF